MRKRASIGGDSNPSEARQSHTLTDPELWNVEESYVTPEQVKALEARLESALQVSDDRTKYILGCRATAWGMDVPESITLETLQDVTRIMIEMGERLNLYIGDLLVSAEHLKLGDITQWATQIGYEAKTLSNWKYICQHVPISLRREAHLFYPNSKSLTMGHYGLVAGKESDEQRHWLKLALHDELSVSELRYRIEGVSKPKTVLQSFREREEHERDKIRLRAKKDFDTWYQVAREQRDAWSELVSDLDDGRPF